MVVVSIFRLEKKEERTLSTFPTNKKLYAVAESEFHLILHKIIEFTSIEFSRPNKSGQCAYNFSSLIAFYFILNYICLIVTEFLAANISHYCTYLFCCLCFAFAGLITLLSTDLSESPCVCLIK